MIGVHNLIGNNEANACRYSPGRSQQAITVGGTAGDDKLFRYSSSGSNYGECVTLYAPAQSLTAAGGSGYKYDKMYIRQ